MNITLTAQASIWDTWLHSSVYNPINFLQAIGSIATALAVYYAFKQSKSGKVQQFESTLFNLIDLHNNIAENLNYDGVHGKNITGKNVLYTALVTAHTKLKEETVVTINGGQKVITHIPITSIEQAKKVCKEQYQTNYYDEFEYSLNHYFRNLYHILKYIYRSNLVDKKSKKFYASLFRAQLSQTELHLLMFNSMHSSYGYPDALFLLKEYNMLQNFSYDFVDPAIWWKYYKYLENGLQMPQKFKDIGV